MVASYVAKSIQKQQKKEEYKDVISHLKRGYSIQNTEKLLSISVNTIHRVKKTCLG